MSSKFKGIFLIDSNPFVPAILKATFFASVELYSQEDSPEPAQSIEKKNPVTKIRQISH